MSIAIVTSALLLVMRPFVTAKAAAEKSRGLLTASLLAENKMQETLAAGSVSEGNRRGDCPANGLYGWSIDSVKAGAEGIDEVTVKVYRKDSPARAESQIVTYINGEDHVQSPA